MDRTGIREIRDILLGFLVGALLLMWPISPLFADAVPETGLAYLPEVHSLTIGGQAYWSEETEEESQADAFNYIVPVKLWF